MSVRLEYDEAIAVITIDDEGTRNALDEESAGQLLLHLAAIDDNNEIKALVLRGEGGHFCSGASRRLLRRAINEPAHPEVMAALSRIYASFSVLASQSVPTIAAVRGAAVGAGLNLALAADVRIVSSESRFLSGFLRVGLHPGGGHFSLLSELAGPETTVAMTLLGEEVRGGRLVELGLAWELVADEEVDARALALARQVGEAELVREATRTFRTHAQSRQMPFQATVKMEQAAQIWSLGRLLHHS